MIRYVTRAVKQWRDKQEQQRQEEAANSSWQGSIQRQVKKWSSSPGPLQHIQLQVDTDGRALVIVSVRTARAHKTEG